MNAAGRAHLPALVVVLLLAVGLRCWGLSWGLRHTPHSDERVFVESVASMIRHGDLDHRFYEYPGLFLYLLLPVLAFLPREALSSPQAYLLARGFVAAFGVASVALVWLLGSRLASPRAGLVAALLVAVSPIEITTSHMVRPDVVLETFVLLGLLAFHRVGANVRADLLAGASLGAATAVKFTGVLLAPSYVLARWFRPGPRLRGTLLAVFTAAAVLAAATPFAILRHTEFKEGVRVQWSYHYRSGAVAPRFDELSIYYLRTIGRSLGPIGCALALGGLVAARRRWREWLPVAAFPVVMLVILSTAEARWIRLIVPVLGAASLIAGLGFEAFARRVPRLAWAVALAGAVAPFVDSVAYVRDIARPGTRDRALDWIEANLKPRARVLTSLGDIGLDRGRHEVLFATGAETDRLLARLVDLVVWSGADDAAVHGLRPVYDAFPAKPKVEGPRIILFTIPEELRPRYRTLPPWTARVSASSGAADVGAALDGRLDTHWKTASRDPGKEWFQVEFLTPIRLGRVELLLGGRPNRAARQLTLFVMEEGGMWRRVDSVAGRAPVDEQVRLQPTGASQVLLVDSLIARGVRIEGLAAPRQRWGFAEVHVDAVEPADAAFGRP